MVLTLVDWRRALLWWARDDANNSPRGFQCAQIRVQGESALKDEDAAFLSLFTESFAGIFALFYPFQAVREPKDGKVEKFDFWICVT